MGGGGREGERGEIECGARRLEWKDKRRDK